MPRALEEFNASHNQINVIPPSWGCLNNLKVINLDGNNVTNVPAEVGFLFTHTHSGAHHIYTKAYAIRTCAD